MGWISKDAWIYPAVPYKEGFREIVLKEDHEKVLAEKDREIVKWSELIGSFTRSQHRYLVEMERLKQALAEKDREIQQIREHEFQRGYQEAEEKYQQILEKSVNTEGAETVTLTREQVEKILDIAYGYVPWTHEINYVKDHDAEQRQTIEQQAQEIARLREALENIVEGEGLWTKNDMAHEAQQALKETGK